MISFVYLLSKVVCGSDHTRTHVAHVSTCSQKRVAHIQSHQKF